MHESFSLDLHGALNVSDALFPEQSATSGECTPRHLEALREALRPLHLLRGDAIEPDGLASRTCLRIRCMRQVNPE
jgi:hypothetical protein